MKTKCTCERPDDNTCDYCEQQSSIQILKEAAENYVRNEPDATLKLISKYSFKDGAEWQQERMYNEEEVLELLLKHQSDYRSAVRNTSPLNWSFDIKKWFNQFKKN